MKEIRRLKQGGSTSHTAAVDLILKKLRSQQITDKLEEDEKEGVATTSQFLPGEIELVMELASVSSRENATRILILREEIYKLRKRGFKTPSIVQILIRRLMDQIENIEEDGSAEEHFLILPAAMKANFQADGLLTTQSAHGGSAKRDNPSTTEGRRQKSGEIISLQPQDNEASPIFPSSLSTTRSVGSAMATTTTTTTTTATRTDIEGTHLRLDAESIEKMKQLKEMRKTRLQWQQRSQTSTTTGQFSNNSNSSKRGGDHPHFNSEKHRLTKKPRGENVHSSTASTAFASSFNIPTTPQTSSSSHQLKL